MPTLMKESLVWAGKRDAEVGIIRGASWAANRIGGRVQSGLKTMKRALDLRRYDPHRCAGKHASSANPAFGYLDYAEFVSAPRTHELAKLNLSSAIAA